MQSGHAIFGRPEFNFLSAGPHLIAISLHQVSQTRTGSSLALLEVKHGGKKWIQMYSLTSAYVDFPPHTPSGSFVSSLTLINGLELRSASPRLKSLLELGKYEEL